MLEQLLIFPVAPLLWVPLVSFAITAVTIPLIKRIALHFKIAATAATPVLEGSTERRVVPLLGGGAIIAGTLAALAMAGELPAWILIGVLPLFVVGAIDDIVVLKPSQKFLGQFIIAGGVVCLYRPVVLSPWPALDALIIIFWLLATTNAFNLVDGLDGLAGGVGIIASLAVAAVGIVYGGGGLQAAVWALALSGGLAGFLLFNYHPASIFMGDSGALPIGLMLGMLALRGGAIADNSHLTRYVFPLLVLLMPLLDTTIVSVTRVATGRPISRRGLDHSHHRLLHLGVTTRVVVSMCWAMAALGALGAVAESMLPYAYAVSVLPFIVLFFAVVGLFMMDLTFDVRPPGLAYGYVHRAARFILSVSYRRRVVEAMLDLALITGAYFGAYLLRLDFHLTAKKMDDLLATLPYVLIPTYVALLLVGVYRGIWRYAGLSELIRFGNGAALAGILLVVTSLLTPLEISGSIVVLFVILLFNFLAATRMSFRTLRKGIHRLAMPRERVLIIGAGMTGAAAARYVFSGQNRNLKLVGFVDDDSFKTGKLVHGHQVLGRLEELESIFNRHPFDQLMIAVDEMGTQRLAEVWQFAYRHHIILTRFSMQIDAVEELTRAKPRKPAASHSPSIGDPWSVGF